MELLSLRSAAKSPRAAVLWAPGRYALVARLQTHPNSEQEAEEAAAVWVAEVDVFPEASEMEAGELEKRRALVIQRETLREREVTTPPPYFASPSHLCFL